MKRKKLSAFIAVILALTFIAGMTGPFAGAANVTIEFLNPLAKIDMHDSLPLAERIPWKLDENGKLTERKVIALTTNGTQFAQIAIAMRLIDKFGKYDPATDAGILLITSSIGGNWGPNTDASYDLYANSPDGLATGGLGGTSGNINTYFTAPAGVLPSTNEWNLAYSAHPNMTELGATTGTANWVGDVDAVLAGTAV